MSKKKVKLNLPSVKDTILAIIGAILCGLGVGFSNFASLGMDSVGIFYDGIRNVLGLSSSQIGTASYVVSFILFVFLWFVGRKYVSFGSVVYIIVYGIFANLGTLMMEHWVSNDSIWHRAVIAVFGILLLFMGLGIYIAIDIGVDAFTGTVLWICDKTHGKMEVVKVIFDLSLTLIGYLLGGKVGILTVITVLVGGPCIGFFTKKFQAIYFKYLTK